LARITLLATSGDTTGLSSEEAALVAQRKKELDRIAATNLDLFNQQVTAAHNFIQAAAQNAPHPDQAFAATKIATERQLGNQVRGLNSEEASLAQRRTAIRSTQAGATAAAAEAASGRQRQTQLTQAGLNALPAAAPEGAAGLALPLYNDLAGRARQARFDQTFAIANAAPGLFGNIA